MNYGPDDFALILRLASAAADSQPFSTCDTVAVLELAKRLESCGERRALEAACPTCTHCRTCEDHAR
jgi:hypothetical protein